MRSGSDDEKEARALEEEPNKVNSKRVVLCEMNGVSYVRAA